MSWRILILVLLSVAYYLLNPYWYGDGVWYALDLKRQSWEIDPGHLIWRPLGWSVFQLLGAIQFFKDPLRTLQLLSSFGAATAVISSYYLSLKLKLTQKESFSVALIFGGSHFLLAYAGSGSAYSMASALTLLAFLVALQLGNSFRSIVFSAISFALATSFWTIAILLAPALCILRVEWTRGEFLASLRPALLQGVALLAFLSLLYLPAYYLSQSSESSSFLAWFGSSSHGIPASLSLINAARAGLGIVITFISLGDFGFFVKQLVFGETLFSYFHFAIFAALAGVFLGFAGVSVLALLRKARHDLAIRRRFAVIITVFIPVLLFAMLWQGSDVERFSLAVPFISILLVDGLSSSTGKHSFSLHAVLAAFVVATNLVVLTLPSIFSGGGLTSHLGPAAIQHLGKNPLLILTGQELGPRVWAPTIYFHDVSVFSLVYDVQTHGAVDWSERLLKELRLKVCAGSRVSVLSDLLGQPTPKGIGLIEKEYPVPKLAEVAQLLSEWPRGKSFEIDGYLFIEIIPPDLSSLCSPSGEIL